MHTFQSSRKGIRFSTTFNIKLIHGYPDYSSIVMTDHHFLVSVNNALGFIIPAEPVPGTGWLKKYLMGLFTSCGCHHPSWSSLPQAWSARGRWQQTSFWKSGRACWTRGWTLTRVPGWQRTPTPWSSMIVVSRPGNHVTSIHYGDPQTGRASSGHWMSSWRCRKCAGTGGGREACQNCARCWWRPGWKEFCILKRPE